MRTSTLVLAAVAVATACLIGCAEVATAQGVPTTIYNYTVRASGNIKIKTTPITDMQTGMFWICYDDMDINATVLQVVDPLNPSRSSPPTVLSSVNIYPGMYSVIIQPMMMGQAAIVAAMNSQGVLTYAYYKPFPGYVVPFPGGSTIQSVTFGDRVPAWRSVFDATNGFFDASSTRVYTAAGCTPSNPNWFTVSLYDLRMGMPSAYSRVFTTNVYSLNCVNSVDLFDNFIAYEGAIWFTDSMTNLISLNETGSTTYNVSNPCRFPMRVIPFTFNIRFVHIGMDMTPGNFGPLFAFILSFNESTTLYMCRLSHRNPSNIEWKNNMTIPLGGWTRVGSAATDAYLVYTSMDSHYSGASTISFFNVTSGALIASVSRPASDSGTYPTPLAAAIGSCQSAVAVQVNGMLTGYCLAPAYQQLWMSPIECQMPSSHPSTNVVACAMPSSTGLALVTTTDGSVRWMAPGISAFRPLVTPDLVWDFSTGNNLAAFGLATVVVPPATQAPVTPSPQSQGSTGSGLSSGATAGVSILLLVVGGVIGAVGYMKVQERRRKAATYNEVLN